MKNEHRMAKILLTGCAGFIGSHLAEKLLGEGYEVLGIDSFDPFYDRAVKERNLKALQGKEGFQFVEADIVRSAELAELPDFDIVVHLAAKAGVLPSLKDPQGYIDTNITGTSNLLELMKVRNRKKLVFASSSSVYGNNKSVPFRETDPVDEQISPYAFTKKSCELMNYSYHHLYGMDILNLRLFTVYGPRQRPDLAIHKFIKLIDADQPINMYGDGSTARDYTFVKDTVDGFVRAIKHIEANVGVYEILNLGNNQPVKLKDLIDAIYSVMGKQPNINVMPMQPGDVNITFADISKAKQLLGYEPGTSLQEGLKAFIDWYYEQKA